jgi:hypothetical protein
MTAVTLLTADELLGSPAVECRLVRGGCGRCPLQALTRRVAAEIVGVSATLKAINRRYLYPGGLPSHKRRPYAPTRRFVRLITETAGFFEGPPDAAFGAIPGRYLRRDRGKTLTGSAPA